MVSRRLPQTAQAITPITQSDIPQIDQLPGPVDNIISVIAITSEQFDPTLVSPSTAASRGISLVSVSAMPVRSSLVPNTPHGDEQERWKSLFCLGDYSLQRSHSVNLLITKTPANQQRPPSSRDDKTALFCRTWCPCPPSTYLLRKCVNEGIYCRLHSNWVGT